MGPAARGRRAAPDRLRVNQDTRQRRGVLARRAGPAKADVEGAIDERGDELESAAFQRTHQAWRFEA